MSRIGEYSQIRQQKGGMKSEADAKDCESGQSLVEFALCIPLFLALVFAIVDFGWMGYQIACFDYCYMNASWTVAASSIVDYDYSAIGAGEISTAEAEQAIENALAASPAPGFDPANLAVNVSSATLTNSSSTYTVPDRNGNEATGTSIERNLAVEAQLTYSVQPIAGLSVFPITITKDLSFSRVVGGEHRAA